MGKVLVIGSINLDTFCINQVNPLNGETVISKKVIECLGGKGANQAIACLKTGSKTTFSFGIGNDDNKNKMLQLLLKNKLKILPFSFSCRSGGAFIFVSGKQKNNMISVFVGANRLLKLNEELKESILLNDIILISQEISIKTIEDIVKFSFENQKMIILNPAPYKKLDKTIFKMIDYIIPNEIEAEQLAGKHDIDTSSLISKILSFGVKNVIITLGANGAIFGNKDGIKTFKSINVKVKDTTGAGDCFCGTFAGFLAKGFKVFDCIKYSIIASGLSVQKLGGIPSYVNLEDIENFLYE